MNSVTAFTGSVLLAFVLGSSGVIAQPCNPPVTKIFVESSEEAKSAYLHWECTSEFSTAQQALDAGISLGTILYGVPLELTSTFSAKQRSDWKRDHCEKTETSSQYASKYLSVMSLVTKDTLNSYNVCIQAHSLGVACWLEEPTTNDGSLVLKTKWTPIPNTPMGNPIVKSSSVAGACPQEGKLLLAKGTNLGAQPSVLLQRSANRSVVAIINTDKGSCHAFLPRPDAKYETKYIDTDPITKQPYIKEVAFESGGRPTPLTGKKRGDGEEFIWTMELPGPVIKVDCGLPQGPHGPWTHVEICTKDGKTVRVEGWKNGDVSTVPVTMRYQMPTEQCTNCDTTGLETCSSPTAPTTKPKKAAM